MKGLKENSIYLSQYSYFKKAKDIGITFRPSDLTLDQVNAFYEIEYKRDLILDKKNGR